MATKWEFLCHFGYKFFTVEHILCLPFSPTPAHSSPQNRDALLDNSRECRKGVYTWILPLELTIYLVENRFSPSIWYSPETRATLSFGPPKVQLLTRMTWKDNCQTKLNGLLWLSKKTTYRGLKFDGPQRTNKHGLHAIVFTLPLLFQTLKFRFRFRIATSNLNFATLISFSGFGFWFCNENWANIFLYLGMWLWDASWE